MTDKIGPVLVTGGTGFLGKSLVRALRQSGEIVVIFDLAEPPAESRVEGVHYVKGDIRDLVALLALCKTHDIRAITHLAAMVIPGCKANPVLGAEVNLIGHINVFEAARALEISRLVYTSSLAARPRAPFDSPVNLYGAYKRCCEDIAKVYALDHGIKAVGLRPNIVYGPERTEGETAAITHAMRAAAQGKPYEMPFRGKMCFQHVDEVTDIFMRCLAADPRKPIVSDLTTELRTVEDLMAAIRAVIPKADVSAADVVRNSPSRLDNTPLRNLLGDWDAVSLEEGTKRTIEALSAKPGIGG
ncbi:NAD(P)-dependent oxidoreductase [Ruegeria sp. 2012CJ41-6]|uniref:NAD(P)-dependent oxidoreductase n=1 Tax=Ruegeria spongiae TaxID=2942209 RepID=A0ABT0Q1L0_9RHOB|nr:NAD(P)-dependent oxidoreductase [Ruegeria spongiae]MCL6283725.1 NAD(P)-dependent oxidoreductase [Ruegeria spongiae]